MVRLARITLGSAVGLFAFLWVLGTHLDDAQRFDFVIKLRTPQRTTAQLFFDRGAGFSQADSAVADVAETDALVDVRIRVPPGRYRAWRFDPGTVPSEYEIGPARLEDGRGRVLATFGPGAFDALNHLRVERRTSQSTVMVSTGPDPQAVTAFGEALVVAPETATLLWLTALALGFMAMGTAAVGLLDWPARGTSRVPWVERSWPAAHGILVVTLASALAAIGAVYPLLAGRSVVAPGNGGAVMLYDRPPYVAGSTDMRTEDSRDGDTGSMMWGILPYSKVQREAVAAGEWPLWNRYSGLGRPLWGQGQSMFLDPIHLVSLLVEDPAAGWDLKFLVARVIFAIGAGLAVFGATGSVFAGVVVGAAAPFIGYFLFRLNHPAAFSITYTPWLLAAFIALARQRDWGSVLRRGAVIAGITALHIVGSTPKEGAVFLLACQVVGVATVLGATGTHADRLRRLVGFSLGGLTALLLAAPHWLIFLDGLSRAWTAYDAPAVRLAEWPHLSVLALGAVGSRTVWPGANMLITIGVMLSLVAPLPPGGRFLWAGCWVAIIGCLAVALGAVPTPWLLKLPLIGNLYSVNTSFLGAAVPPMLLVAGCGFAGLANTLASTGRRAVLVVLLVVLVVALFHWQGGTGAVGGAMMSWVLVTLAAGTLFPWVCGAWLSRAPTRLAGVTTVALAMVMLAPGGLHLEAGVPQLDDLLMQPRPRADLDRESPAVAAARASTSAPYRAIGLDFVFFAGTQALQGIEGIIGADAIEWPRLREIGTAAGMFRHPWIWLSPFSADDLDSMAGLLDMFGVSIVFTPPEIMRERWREVDTGSSDLIRVVERPTAWPRAFFVDAIQRYDRPEDLIEDLRRTREPFGAVQSSDAEAVAATSRFAASPRQWRPARRYRLTPNTTTFDIEAPGAGVAVLAEAHDPADFVATLDETPVPYFRVNHALKGVVIPGPGTWTVRFVYRPALWTAAWAVAAIGLVLLIAVVLAKPLLK